MPEESPPPRELERLLPKLDFTFDPDHMDESARRLLTAFRPDLAPHLGERKLKIDVVSGGITNKLLAVHLVGEKETTRTLIRVYGENTEKIIDRVAELRTIMTLHKHGCAGKIYGTFDNGMCYEYMQGEPLTLQTVRQPEICRLIIRKMVQMHCIYREKDTHPQFSLFDRMRDMYNLMPDRYDNEERQQKLEEFFPDRRSLDQEISLLENELTKGGGETPKVFCHNDLLCANILYDKCQGVVNFIDFEYAGMNYQAFDLANFFNEFAGVGDSDYSLMPDRQFQLDFLRYYLEQWNKVHQIVQPITDDQVEHLHKWVTKFTLASHLLWTLWTLIQAEYSSIEFDFLNYGRARYTEYKKRRDERLAL